LGTRGPEDIQIIVLGLPGHRRSRAASGPDAGERAFLAESRLVLKERQDTLIGMGDADLLNVIDYFF
jgi:hypothetical protein